MQVHHGIIVLFSSEWLQTFDNGGVFILGSVFVFFWIWLLGFSASWLLGFLAFRLLVGLCGFWWLFGFGFSHPLLCVLAFAPFHWFFDLAARIISITSFKGLPG